MASQAQVPRYVRYRLAWARTYLKGIGALNNSERGVWSTTDLGRGMTADEVARRHAEYVAKRRETRKAKEQVVASGDTDDEPLVPDGDGNGSAWKERLLDQVLKMPPDGFERLARRLLREAGFTAATVIGKSGDGGIDGVGVYRMSLVSFPVVFQCKRYKGSVGAGPCATSGAP